MLAAAGAHGSSLDIPTLLFVAVSLATLLGLFLILAWAQQREVRALAWWGSAYLIGASSMAMWRTPAPALDIPLAVPEALTFLACGMIWSGVRLFHGRPVSPLGTCAGALGWLIANDLTVLEVGSVMRIALGASVVAAYTFVIAFELWRERRKSMFSRFAAFVVPSLHATIFLMPIAIRALLPQAFASAWVTLLALEAIIYGVGTAFIVLLMVKDHHVHIYRHAATTDVLTGLLNRRAFMEYARNLCAACGRRREPVTLLMFDLDKFKSINDTYGHAVGDDVLRVFAQVAGSSMRATDIVARLGGEEFAAILPGDMEVARKVAERVRANFEVAGKVVGAHPIGGTVSIGAATSHAPVTDIDALINRADEALYKAKHNGRNRMETADDLPVPDIADAEERGKIAYFPVRKRAARRTRPATA
ncbi:GGDEF domain-containing protein [Microbacteriaceae bacterium K1510]|nr:GGDEF domain-containing protein [Microbacteriaceae bacterium K1510]